MPLTGPHFQQLQHAVLSAFPTHSELGQMVRFALNENLDAIGGTGRLADVVFNLITWTEAQGRTEELIVKLRAANLGNAALRDIAEALHVSTGTPHIQGITNRGVYLAKIKVLFLSANPAGTPPLALDEEMREITHKIRASEHRDSVELISRWAVRPDDLLQALNEHKPHIVHFSGHGSSTDEIILLDNDRNPKPVSKAALESLFRTLKDNVEVVILNACYSRPQAEAITQVIDCAIGMNKAIGDQASIVFAASFYRAIGFGRSVQEAFDQGKTALLLEGIPEEKTPELLVRQGVDASLMFSIKSVDRNP